MAIYTADITVHNGTGVVTLKCATEGFDDYVVNIIDPGVMKMMLFSSGRTMGPSELGRGMIVFSNADGALDQWLNYGFGGREIVIKKWVAGVAVLTMSCAMEQPVPSGNEMSIRLKDVQVKLTAPLQSSKYAGTNALPNGLEGVDDIKGKPKPLLYGKVFNATPVLVNTSKLIYQGNDGALQDIPAVYDKGVSLTRGSDYTNQADMEANQPAEGQYRVWPAGGYFRLGSSPAGQVTFDGVEGANAPARTVAQIAKRLSLRVLASGDLVDADFTDLDALNSAEAGIYINQETTVSAALDEVMGSIGAWYGFDSDAKFNVGRLDPPAGTPIKTLTQYDISSIEFLPTEDEGRGLPVWKVNLNYGKNYTVQAADLAGSILSLPSEWVAHTTPSMEYWDGIAYGNGVFAAIVTNTNKVFTSPDGIIWTQRTLPATTSWRSIAFGNGVFVALSQGTNIAATSPDGITWTQRTLPATTDWFDITCGNGVFVAVAFNSNIAATSPDGITWTQRTISSSRPWKSITYGNGIFVVIAGATGAANVVATSPDGITWTNRSLVTTTTETLISVTYGNGVFVTMSADTNSTFTSVDGDSWSRSQLPVSAMWASVVYGGGLFMATPNTGAVGATSIDGKTWKPIPFSIPNAWSVVGYGDGVFVALRYTSDVCNTYRVRAGNARCLYLEKEYRTVTAEDAGIKTVHPLATEINLNSLLVDAAAAQTEAARQLDLRKVRRDYIAVKLSKIAMNELSVFPSAGKIIKLEYPRYGYDAGKLFTLIGYEVFNATEELTLYLWG